MKNPNRMKILITGATGFIGTHLCQYFKEKGIEVFELNREKGFDISKSGWTKNIKIKNIHTVVHLAQSNNYRDFENKSEEIFQTNVSATKELLEWSKINNVKRFVYTSSFNVYENNSNPRREDSKLGAESFYGLTKSISEQLVSYYSRFFETVILRLNTVFGGKQTNALIPQMVEKIINNEIIYLAKGDGLILSPIYVNDLSRIFLKLIESKEKFDNEIINVGGEETVSLAEIVKILSNNLNVNPKTQKTDSELKFFISDSTKLRDFLNNQFLFTPIEIALKEVCNTNQLRAKKTGI